jgi:MFS family permease
MIASASLGKNFNIFMAGQIVSHIGHALMHLALPILVFETTGSVSDMGLATASIGVGRFAGGLVAGPVVDRLDRRRVMLFCDVASVLVYAAVPLFWFFGLRDVLLLYAVAFAGNIFGNCFYVAQVAALPSLVERSQLTDANGRMMAGQAAAIFIGPFLGGVLCATMGAEWVLGADSLTFVVSALCLLMIRLRPHHPAAKDAKKRRAHTGERAGKPLSVFDSAVAGVRFVWQSPVLRALVVMMAATEFMIAGSIDLFVFHLKSNMGQGDVAVGTVFAVGSLGAIAGGVLAALIRRRLGFGVSLLAMLTLEGACMIIMGHVHTVAAVAVAASVYAFGSSGFGVYTTTIRQELTPEALLGRMTAAFSVIILATAPLGAAGATYLAAHIGVTRVMVIMGAGYIALAAAGVFTPVRKPFAAVPEPDTEPDTDTDTEP